MRSSVYIETTIPSYLTARPSRDLIKAAQQQITQEWWEQRERFELYASELVVQEVERGDSEAAAARLRILEGLRVLQSTEEAESLALRLLDEGPLPQKAALDAAHIGIAVVHGIEYLLTWNCKHLANAALRHRIDAICEQAGYGAPVICTPNELMEI